MTAHFPGPKDFRHHPPNAPDLMRRVSSLPVRWKAQAPYGIHRSDWLKAGAKVISAIMVSGAIMVAALAIN